MSKTTTLARLLSAAALLALPLASWAQGAIVISQVYGGGGGGSATTTYSYNQDFVEIFNRSTNPVNISGYTIQYASAAGGFNGVSPVVPTGTTLAPGQYYSFALGAVGTVGANLPATDLSTANMVSISATNGKVALVKNNTAVGTSFTSANIVDLVGFGTANYAEGSAVPNPINSTTTAATATPVLSTTTSAQRLSGGCIDTDKNNNDFTVITTRAPYTMATTAAPCSTVSPANTALTITAGTFTDAVVGGTPSSTTATYVLNNSGSTDQTVAITTSGAPFSVSPATVTVAAGGTANVTVTFAPTAGGTFTGTLTAAVAGFQNVTSSLSAKATAPPTITATSATGNALLTGIPTVLLVSGTGFVAASGTPPVNNTTVAYSNGTVGTVTVLSGSVLKVVITPNAGAGNLTVTTATGTSSAFALTASAPATANLFEPFESGDQPGYAATPTPIALSSGSVTTLQTILTNVDFSSIANDKRNNSQSARIRGGGYVQFTRTNGVSSISLSAATYGNDTNVSFTISYSTDGGTTFNTVVGTPAATAGNTEISSTLTTYGPYAINASGNVIVRINDTNTTAGASARVNVDDVKISDFVATDLVVASGQTVSQGGTYNNVTVQSGGTLTVTSPLIVANTITVSGRLNQNCQPITGTASFTLNAGGTLGICDADGITTNAAQGAILVTGTRTYSADANYVYNGAVQNSGGGLTGARNLSKTTTGALTLNSPVSVSQVAAATSGNIISGGNLTLLSSANGTALVAGGSGGTNVTGAITAQRYIGGIGGQGYRMLGSPVSTTANDLTTGGSSIDVSGATAYNSAASPGTVTPFPTLYLYNQARVGTVGSDLSPFNQGFQAIEGLGRGIEPGDGVDFNTTSGQTIKFSGQLRTATFNATLPNSGNPGAGWSLVGNPFAAPISWDAVTLGANVSTTVYVSRATGRYSGAYTTYTKQAPIQTPPNASSIIPLGQAFFVYSSANTANTLSIPASSRVATYDPTLHPVQRQAAETRTALRLALSGAADLEPDYAVVYFDQQATTGYDVQYDAIKLYNTGNNLNLYTSIAGQALALNALPLPGTSAVVVPVAVRVPQAGTFALALNELANLPAGATLELRDALTGTSTVLSEGTSYSFSTSTTATVGRFTLVLNAAAAPLATAGQALAAQIGLYPNPTHDQFRLELPLLSAAQVQAGVHAELLNVLGQVVRQLPLHAVAGQALQTDVSVRDLGAGIYQLRLTVGNTQAVRRVVVE